MKMRELGIHKYHNFNIPSALSLLYSHQKGGAFLLFSGKQVFAKMTEFSKMTRPNGKIFKVTNPLSNYLYSTLHVVIERERITFVVLFIVDVST